MRLTGFQLLAKVYSLDPCFTSGPPWNEKAHILRSCGYERETLSEDNAICPSDFHEAFEDARIFAETYDDYFQAAESDPDDLFDMFFLAIECFSLEEIDEQIKDKGIDSLRDLVYDCYYEAED